MGSDRRVYFKYDLYLNLRMFSLCSILEDFEGKFLILIDFLKKKINYD